MADAYTITYIARRGPVAHPSRTLCGPFADPSWTRCLPVADPSRTHRGPVGPIHTAHAYMITWSAILCVMFFCSASQNAHLPFWLYGFSVVVEKKPICPFVYSVIMHTKFKCGWVRRGPMSKNKIQCYITKVTEVASIFNLCKFWSDHTPGILLVWSICIGIPNFSAIGSVVWLF